MRKPSRREASPARGLPSARQAALAIPGAQTGSRDGYIEHEGLFCKIVWGVMLLLLANISSLPEPPPDPHSQLVKKG